MTDKILSILRKKYHLRSLDAGVFHKIVIRGMDFEINSFEAAELGRVATMRASGLCGLVKRDILIVSPLQKAAPIVTYERVQAFGKDTLILASYDHGDELEYIEKIGKKSKRTELDMEAEAYFVNYLKLLDGVKSCKGKERQVEMENLVNAILAEGRISSDIFRANYGTKIMEKLYHQVMFGTR